MSQNLLRPMLSHFSCFSLRPLKWGMIKSSTVTATRALMLDDTVLEKKTAKRMQDKSETFVQRAGLITGRLVSATVNRCIKLLLGGKRSFELYLTCDNISWTQGLTSGCRCRRRPQTGRGFRGSPPVCPWRGRAAAGLSCSHPRL